MAKASSIVSLSAAAAIVVAVGVTVAILKSDIFAQQYSNTQTAIHEIQYRLVTIATEQFSSEANKAYWTAWQDALMASITDSYTAAASISVFWYLTIRPIVWLVYTIVKGFVQLFYEYVLARGIFSPRAIAQMKMLVRKSVEFQLSMTPRQIAVEVGVIVSAGILFRFLKFLQRRNYLRRTKLYCQRKKRAIAQVRCYCVMLFVVILYSFVEFVCIELSRPPRATVLLFQAFICFAGILIVIVQIIIVFWFGEGPRRNFFLPSFIT
jgi:uncharacterized protein with PQ loop repeat